MPTVKLARPTKARYRLTWKQRLQLLDPLPPERQTEWRLRQLMQIFVPRYMDGIITKAKGGPRDWTKLKGRIYLENLVRHLLADMRPELNPQWIGARSYEVAKFVCIDVDCDRSPESQAIEQPELELQVMLHQLQNASATVPLSYQNRCRLLEFVLQQLGIDANNKHQVLIQQTPSGGRHYYLFFDQKEYLFNLRSIFETAGLRFKSGQFEFFPSTTQGLRLTFGHIPGLPHDPRRWIWFVEAYRRGQIVRHNQAQLLQRAENFRKANATTLPTPTAARATAATPRSKSIRSGSPRSQRTLPPPESVDTKLAVVTPIKSTAEIDVIWSQGIIQLGTRTAILKILIAHLIFIRGQSAEEAAEKLITWAMNAHHRSHDIAHDLEYGTQTVAKHIQRMCRWHVNKRDPTRVIQAQPCFTQAEVQFLTRHLEQTNPQNVATYALFLLYFLRFAKRYGTYDAEQQAWACQPAVNAVIRKWPGCRAEQSKLLVEQATKLGILKLIKGSWHNPQGTGRARTYQLRIPSEPDQVGVFNLEQAEQQLLELRISHSRNQAAVSPANALTPVVPNRMGECHDRQYPVPPSKEPNSTPADPAPATVPKTRSGNALERGSRASTYSQDVHSGLRRRDPKNVSRPSWSNFRLFAGDYLQRGLAGDRAPSSRSLFGKQGASSQRILIYCDWGTLIAHIHYSAGAIDMAHELATTNGRTAMFYTGEAPWHRLGTKLDNPAKASEAIIAAGLDYTVEKLPLFTTDGEEARQRQAVVRGDTREVLGVVGRGYTPIQNRTAFEFLDSVVQADELRYHTAGALGRGEKIWLLAKLPGTIRVKNSDDITEKFLLLSNSHDGSAALRVFFTPIRVVCQNTLNLALSKGQTQGVSIQHRGDLESKIVEAQELLGFAQHIYKDVEQQAEVLASVYPSLDQLESYFKALSMANDGTSGTSN